MGKKWKQAVAPEQVVAKFILITYGHNAMLR